MERGAGLKGVGLSIGAAVIVVAGGLAGYQAWLNQRMLPNVVVAGQPVGGLSVAAARDKARSATADLSTIPVTVTVDTQSWSTNAAELGFTYDFDTALQRAFQIGHNGSPFTGIQTQASLIRQPAQVDVTLTADTQLLNRWIASIAAQTDKHPIDADLSVNGTSRDGRAWSSRSPSGPEVSSGCAGGGGNERQPKPGGWLHADR